MGGRIVIGVDGSAGSVAALRWAVDEARHRDATVEAVMCRHEGHSPGSALGRGERSLDRVLDANGLAARADLGFELLQTTAEGKPGPTLCSIARDADLLVVGSRGHGEIGGMMLGSVSQHCTHHSPCPVVVVPS